MDLALSRGAQCQGGCYHILVKSFLKVRKALKIVDHKQLTHCSNHVKHFLIGGEDMPGPQFKQV